MAPMIYLGAWGTLIHEKNLKPKISCQTPFNRGIGSVLIKQGDFWKFFRCTLFKIASSAAPQIPLCRSMRGSKPELLRLWHWQSDALYLPLDKILSTISARSHPHAFSLLNLFSICTENKFCVKAGKNSKNINLQFLHQFIISRSIFS